MNEIYVKELPKRCIKCNCRASYYYADDDCAEGSRKHDSECVPMRTGLSNEEVFKEKPDWCPLHSLDAHDKQVRAETAREIIDSLDNFREKIEAACVLFCKDAYCSGRNHELIFDDGENYNGSINEKISDRICELFDELSEQYKVGE